MQYHNAIFSTAYFPPIAYLQFFLQTEHPYIEVNEHFVKQTYRNRCLIPTANGILHLSIPVIKNGLHHCPISQVRLDYSQPWQRTHWRALEAAYNASPFFLYYRDALEPFFVQREIQTLLDFNQQLFDTLLKLFGINKTYSFTTDYKENYEPAILDLRNEIHPKKQLIYKQTTPYRQVFSDRLGFIPNLSCIDLLFNEGKYAVEWLKIESL